MVEPSSGKSKKGHLLNGVRGKRGKNHCGKAGRQIGNGDMSRPPMEKEDTVSRVFTETL